MKQYGKIIILLFVGLFFAGKVIAENNHSTSVIINDKPLNTAEVQKLAASFGAPIAPGRYWYDKKSGGWGQQCGPGLGIGQAGLNLGGELKANASCGHTGVFINGRELHIQDVKLLQSLSGHVVPGRYWMDAQLNAGVEGGPALVNYRALAASNNKGKDKFWRSRYGYGAGNSNADGSQGYVSVPGYGPVGYGF